MARELTGIVRPEVDRRALDRTSRSIERSVGGAVDAAFDAGLRRLQRAVEDVIPGGRTLGSAFDAGRSRGGGGGRRGGGAQARRRMAESIDLDRERNALLRRLLSETEKGNFTRARRGGGGGLAGAASAATAAGAALSIPGVAGLAAGGGLIALATALNDFSIEFPVDIPIPVDLPPFPVPIPVSRPGEGGGGGGTTSPTTTTDDGFTATSPERRPTGDETTGGGAKDPSLPPIFAPTIFDIDRRRRTPGPGDGFTATSPERRPTPGGGRPAGSPFAPNIPAVDPGLLAGGAAGAAAGGLLRALREITRGGGRSVPAGRSGATGGGGLGFPALSIIAERFFPNADQLAQRGGFLDGQDRNRANADATSATNRAESQQTITFDNTFQITQEVSDLEPIERSLRDLKQRIDSLENEITGGSSGGARFV